MVIQRIQTLWLILAVNLTVLFCIISLAGDFSLCSAPALYISGYTTAALIAIDCFLYKNLRLQMRVASVSAMLLVALGVAALVASPDGVPFRWWTLAFPGAGVVFCILARRGMMHDYKLLRSTDRLR